MSYTKPCNKCGERISMRQMPAGQWLAFDVSTEEVHECGIKNEPDIAVKLKGRKNVFLVKSINKLIDGLELIDDYGIDGDFIESQAFAYLGIRSHLKLPISFPETTGCNKPCIGGVAVKNC